MDSNERTRSNSWRQNLYDEIRSSGRRRLQGHRPRPFADRVDDVEAGGTRVIETDVLVDIADESPGACLAGQEMILRKCMSDR